MKSVAVYVALVLFVLGIGTDTAWSQEPVSRPRVGIARLEAAADSRVRAAADSIYSTIDLTLRLLDRYDVRSVRSFDFVEGTPPTDAQLRNLDFILFGSVQDEAGEITLDLAVYSRSENRVTVEHQERITSIFDLFDAADDAAIAVLEGFSGELIRFTTLRLTNTGSRGRYSVFLDETLLGEDVEEARVLVETRTVRVTQDRMLREHVVYEGSHTFVEEAVTTVEFSIPLATSQEQQTLTDLEQRIVDNWDDPAQVPMVGQLFNRVFFLLDDISYSPGLSEYRDNFRELQRSYQERLAEGFEDETPEKEREDEPAVAEPPSREERPAPGVTWQDAEPVGPPEVNLAVGLKTGAGIGWFNGPDWRELIDDTPFYDGPNFTAMFGAFGYYHVHPNFAIHGQLGAQRYAAWYGFDGWSSPEFGESFVDMDFDYTLIFWTYDFSLLARPTIRSELITFYGLFGPQLTLHTTDITVRDVNDGFSDVETFSLEDNPVLGLALGIGFGIYAGRLEFFGEMLYARTGFALDDLQIIGNSVKFVAGLALHVN